MKNACAVAFISLSLVFISGALLSQQEWAASKSGEGITVYTKDVPGSAFKEFKGVAMVNANIEVVGRVIDDIPAAVQWMKDTKVSTLVETRGKDATVQYNEITAPWPVSNRDVVVYSKTTRTPDRITYNYYATTHPSQPARPGKVRITKMTGYWMLMKKGDDKTLVIYQNNTDPAGSLPAWLVNKTVTEQPYYTLRDLRKMVTMAKYRK